MNSLTNWQNVLLTDSGFFDPFDLHKPLAAIVDRFIDMVGKPLSQARVLFIPAAAWDEESRYLAAVCRWELEQLGIVPEHITDYMLDGTLTEAEAMAYDVMFFTGGWAEHLLKLVKAAGFDAIVKNFVYANKVYVGVSAGSVLATPNIMGCFGGADDPKGASLGLVNAYIDCHCDMRPDLAPKTLPLPHIMLHFYQALAVSSRGYELIQEPGARHTVDWSAPPVMGVDLFRLDRPIEKI